VSEDAVSSSCNEFKATRNAYVQAGRPDVVSISIEKLNQILSSMKEHHAIEMSQNKKKQWVRTVFMLIFCTLQQTIQNTHISNDT
jgi:hypothetical protein